MIETLTCLIPAGGEGTRLRPHTEEIQKPMLLMGASHRRIIDFSLGLSREADHVLVTTNVDPWKAEQVETYVADRADVRVLRDLRRIGAGSLLDYYPVFEQEDPDGDLVVLPADMVYENFELKDFHEKHRETGADVTLLVVAQKDYGEYVIVDGERATRIVTEPAEASLSTTGVYMFKNRYLLDWMKKELERGWNGEPRGMYRDIIGPAVKNNRASIYKMPDGGYWDDAGTLRRYHCNNMRYSLGQNVISPSALVGDNTQLIQCVVLGSPIIGPGAIFHEAIISGVGNNTIVTRNIYE